MKTQAAILTDHHKPLVLADVEIPELKRGQVLVQIKATGVCGSQLGEIDGKRGPDPWLPHLLGHEAGGIVEHVGPEVTHVKEGTRVVLHWRPSLGIEAETPKYQWNGQVVNAGRITTFQKKTIVSENRLTPISNDLPFDQAALYGCCLTTGFGIIENDAQLKKGQSILIVGVGGIGLVTTIAAKIKQADPIIAADIHDHKLAAAKKFGATHLINTSKENIRVRIKEILRKRPLDVVLENTGITNVIELCYELCGPQGRTILVGVPSIQKKVQIDTLPLHFGKILTGSHGGNSKPNVDIPKILKLQKDGVLNLSGFIEKRYSLNQINQAIDDLRQGLVIRPIIYVD